jgi:hypothetical protein
MNLKITTVSGKEYTINDIKQTKKECIDMIQESISKNETVNFIEDGKELRIIAVRIESIEFKDC